MASRSVCFSLRRSPGVVSPVNVLAGPTLKYGLQKAAGTSQTHLLINECRSGREQDDVPLNRTLQFAKSRRLLLGMTLLLNNSQGAKFAKKRGDEIFISVYECRVTQK